MAADPRCIPLALYVHIPWCERKCPYCDFNSHEGFSPAIESDYVDALIADLHTQQPSALDRELVSVFIGGGTPSLFTAASIHRLLDAIAAALPLSRGAELTLECNPGSTEAAKFQGYRQAGINRLSIGVQSFHDDSLKRLGRIHDGNQARSALDKAARYFDRFNIDLMHGLPGQSVAMAVDDITEGLERARGHLSWYQLTIEPNTAFWSATPTLPVENTLEDQQQLGETALSEAGFSRYEVSAWSQSGEASRHNLNYWQFGDYIGIGAGAHGKLTQPSGTVIRTQRSRIPRDYLASIHEAREPRVSAVPHSALKGEALMNGLRLSDGIDVDLLTQRTGSDIGTLNTRLDTLKGRGLLVARSDRIQTTTLGYRFLDSVVAELLED